jgi:hypothetical protein
MKTGLPIFFVLLLYLQQNHVAPSSQLPNFPDPAKMYEIPQSRQELKENLTYVCQLQYRWNLPIYLMPDDCLDRFQPNFVLLQLYYHYIRFSQVRIPPLNN